MPTFFCLFPTDVPLILDQRSVALARDDGVQNIVPIPPPAEYAVNILYPFPPDINE